MTARPRGSARLLLTASLMLLAFNMRPALSSIGPILPEAMRDTGLDPASAGLVTTIPVLCLGFFGLATPLFARRWGAERAVLVFMLVLAAGLGLRILPGAAALVLGCGLGGVGIGVVNVLVPGIIKRAFPDRSAAMMGVYTMALCAGAAAAAGASAPLLRLFGSWNAALAVWAAPALAASALWLSQLGAPPDRNAPRPPRIEGLWRDSLAWQVTLFMGLGSALAYSVFAWLAPMLRARGFSAIDAGLVVSVALLGQAPAALVAPVLAGRARDQRVASVICVAFSIAGFAGCLFAPAWQIWLWAVVLSIGQGATFAMALTVIVLRSAESSTAAALSAMAQGTGYTLGAAGPLLIGLLRAWTGGWTASALLFFGLAVLCAVAGYGAGRAAQVRVRTAPAPAAA